MKPEPLKVKDPYPEDIFPEITKDEWKRIDELLKKGLGFSLDRVSANIGRRVRKQFLEDIKNACEFYLKYKDNPEMFFKDFGLTHLFVKKEKIQPSMADFVKRYCIQQYQEALFKLAFKDVLGGN